MSKPAPAPPTNPWDPAAWTFYSPKQVKRDGKSEGVEETVRSPTTDEIRVLQSAIPEAAGTCLFVLEREAGAPSPADVLPEGIENQEAQIHLVNAGYARESIPSPQSVDPTFERIKDRHALLLTSLTRTSIRSPFRFKKVSLWESTIEAGLNLLHTPEAIDGSRAFGRFTSGYRVDPGYRADFTPNRLTYIGGAEAMPPVIYPKLRGNLELLIGFSPRRAQTLGEEGEPYRALAAGFPRLVENGAYWLTGMIDDAMTSHGFVLATVFSDPNRMNAERDPGVFSSPPWVPVSDPAAVASDSPLVALFSLPEEAEHVAMRSSWAFGGEQLFESRIDLAPPSPRGLRIVHRLEALQDGAVGTITAYYTLAPP